MVLRNAAAHRDKRLLLPVARDMMKACCPRFLRLALEQEDLQAMSDNSDDEADGVVDDSIEKLARCAAPIIAPPPLYLSLSLSISLPLYCICSPACLHGCPLQARSSYSSPPVLCRKKSRFEGLGMSNARSTVLGKDVKAGEVDSNKIDGATGNRPASVHVHELQASLENSLGR
jgi:hypothetical protein